MKSRISLYALLGLLLIVFGGVMLFYRWGPQERTQVFPATVDRDCAPWDGGAFTVSIPLRDGGTLHISMYQSPEIKLPSSFSFPDETLREGNVLLLPPVGVPEQLAGKVWFPRVSEESPVEGSFRFNSEAGTRFEGKFVAEWGDEIVYCG